jgi:hypothetical protein
VIDGDKGEGTPGEMISHFEINASILDLTGSEEGIDHAIATLAAWMSSALPKLNADDLAILARVGGILYRAGNSSE